MESPAIPERFTPGFQNLEADPNKNPARFYRPDFLNRVWREAVAEAGFEPIQLKNATRHSLGNQKRRQGWDSRLIARLLGHASDAHTTRFYVQDDTSLLKKELFPGPPARLDKKDK